MRRFLSKSSLQAGRPIRNDGRSLRRSAGVAAGPTAGRGERPGAVRWPWRATWGRPPAVESGLGPSASRGERPGAVRRPWRAAWGRPPAVESGWGPSAGRGEQPGAVRQPWRAAWGRPLDVESGLGLSAGHGERPGAVPAIPNQQAIIAGLGGLRGLRLSLKTLWWRWRWRWRRRRTH
jgi:hypothetical protein